MKKILPFSVFFGFVLAIVAFRRPVTAMQDSLSGAWTRSNAMGTEVLMFTDGYASYTGYAKADRKFLFTTGGPYRLNGGQVEWTIEYDTRNDSQIGNTVRVPVTLSSAGLTTTFNKTQQQWQRADAGNAPLAGAWQITQRMQDGNLQTIHQTGTRNTIKLLTGNRFQWVAIDPAVKGFYGTGGGTYDFSGGKYTEHIEFFSRDSSRVGASLTFDGKLEQGDWHHSGKSSKGEDIYEVWSRGKK